MVLKDVNLFIIFMFMFLEVVSLPGLPAKVEVIYLNTCKEDVSLPGLWAELEVIYLESRTKVDLKHFFIHFKNIYPEP